MSPSRAEQFSARLGSWPFPSSSGISLLKLGNRHLSILQNNCISFFIVAFLLIVFLFLPQLHKEPSLVCLLIELQAHFCIEWNSLVKVGFFQKMMAKYSNLWNRHACEPKIVSELLFPVNVINTFMGNILTHLAKKSAYYES